MLEAVEDAIQNATAAMTPGRSPRTPGEKTMRGFEERVNMGQHGMNRFEAVEGPYLIFHALVLTQGGDSGEPSAAVSVGDPRRLSRSG